MIGIIEVLVLVVLVIAAWTDIRRYIIPDWLTFGASGGVLFYWIWQGEWMSHLLAGLALFFLLCVLIVITEGGLGGGDVKLLTFLALALGFPVASLLLLSIPSAVLCGRLLNMKEVPLAPHVLVGYLFWLVMVVT